MKAFAISLNLFVVMSVVAAGTLYAEAPIAISTIEELQLIGNDVSYPLDGHYIITQNIDASDTASWNSGRGFDPIGSWYVAYPFGGPQITPFEGHLDGQGHTISGLVINQPEEGAFFIGLLVAIGESGIVENLNLMDFNITGQAWIGALAGHNAGMVAGCHAAGTIYGTEYTIGGFTGMLIGENLATGILSACNTSGVILSEGYEGAIGGMAGLNRGAIDHCYSSATVEGNNRMGGLVGAHLIPGNHTHDGEPLMPGTLTNSYATGTVTGLGSIGGLVGINGNSGDSFQPFVVNCYASGAVTTAISEWESGPAGGLIGTNHGIVRQSHAIGPVSGDSQVGGLVGSTDAPGELFQCFARGNVTAFQSYAGGLVGGSSSSRIIQCFATGDVTATHIFAGGLVGLASYGEITQCYAQGAVIAEALAAGLVVEYSSMINQCYSTGLVTGISATPGSDDVAGLAIAPPENVIASFWDVETSGQTESGGGVGLSTDEMQQKSTFKDAGWDFMIVWGIEEGVSYPCLRWTSPDCEGDAALSVHVVGSTVVRRAVGARQSFKVTVANAIGDVSYQWYFDGGDKNALPIPNANEAVYTIPGVDYTDAGWYSCIVSDDYFTVESGPMQLVVASQLSVLNFLGAVILFLLMSFLGVFNTARQTAFSTTLNTK